MRTHPSFFHPTLGWLERALPSLPVFILAFLCCAMVTLLILGGVHLSLSAVIGGYAVPVGAYVLMVVVRVLAPLIERIHMAFPQAQAR